MPAIAARDRIIVALDLPSVGEAAAMVERLGDSVTFYKVGLELAYAGGIDFARDLVRSGKKVFLDLKLHDIPNTVARATERVADVGATYLTVHAFPHTMRAALEGSAGSGLKVLAVTVLTSNNDADLAEAGYAVGVADLVRRRALQAAEIGVGGIVLSPEEATAMRALVGGGLDLVTPGIRPAGSDVGDQKRVMTPRRAIEAGADRLVIGRPITQSQDPKATVESIVLDIQQ
ncbi:orotidine-5'-phosphate decarboxylase [uncultured Alsobacter sp.]|uniref:orotidine-5'-phosphate decarboxylase n=1 Tax=uncultured Alsobacter sp. TaxID=1748258 RepID=UPI0025E47A3F|nr:orotidine-5'-phosphate decarboxylase [uncultured Alsobacter sp.]